MAKSKLVPQDHSLLFGEKTVEVWYKGKMVATVYGADGPGVRVISKHPMDIVRGGLGEDLTGVKAIEVRIETGEDGN